MLDIKFIRQNPSKVKEGCRKKQVKVDIDRLLEVDKRKREIKRAFEALRAKRNLITKKIAKKKIPELIKEAKKIKKEIIKKENELKTIELEYEDLMDKIPNLPLDNVPEGKDESENVVLYEVGERKKFDFQPKPHWELGENLGIIDTERSAKTSGTRFGFLKGKGAQLEFALINFVLETLLKEGFELVLPPFFLKPEMMGKMGYLNLKLEGKERKWESEEVYFLRDDDLILIGTSEQIIGAMHADEIFDEKDLPKRYLGFSSCFRREAGAYGKDVRGIFRVHQFDKVEMFVFCKPTESIKEHKKILALEEKLIQKLGIPYRVVQLCSGDLAKPSAETYDLESWFPGQNKYKETHSCSNCTDFQARRLNIRYRDSKLKRLNFVHTLNGTAFAIGRTILAILENYQQKDGSIKIPKVLDKYLPFREIRKQSKNKVFSNS